jgi:hypothetical protein
MGAALPRRARSGPTTGGSNRIERAVFVRFAADSPNGAERR